MNRIGVVLKKRVKTILAPLSDDTEFFRDPHEESPVTVRGCRTVEHINDLIKKYRGLDRIEECMIVATTGFNKVAITPSDTNFPISIADQMGKYILRHYPVIETERVVTLGVCFGIQAQILSAIYLALASELVNADKDVEIVFCTNPVRMKEVRKFLSDLFEDLEKPPEEKKYPYGIPRKWSYSILTSKYDLGFKYRLRGFAQHLPLIGKRYRFDQ